MVDGIAVNWRRFGANDPHWSVLTKDEFRSSSIGDKITKFYHSGLDDVRMLLAP